MLHHVELRVSNLKPHLAFWDWLMVDMLGYERFQDWDGGRSWRSGPGTPYVVISLGEDRVPDHIAFLAYSRARVDLIWDGVEARGGSRLYEHEYPHADGPNHYAAYFCDPGGIKIEVVAE